MRYLLTQVRRIGLGLALVVVVLAAARGLYGDVPPGYVTAPLIVLGAAAAVGLDVLVARRFSRMGEP